MFGGPKRFRVFSTPDANIAGLIPKAWGGPGAGPGAVVDGSTYETLRKVREHILMFLKNEFKAKEKNEISKNPKAM